MNSLFSLSGELVTVTTPSDCRWLHVEFRPHGGGGGGGGCRGEEEEDRKSAKVPASGNMFIAEVKQRAIEELRLEEHLSGKKRFIGHSSDDHPRPVSRKGSHDLTAVFALHLEHGALCWNGNGHHRGADLHWEGGNGWHLRTLDWCDEVGEPLADEDASLTELSISSGDTLVITPGPRPPKVLTLPALQSVCVPTPAFLRVWQLEGRRPARVLRGQQLTLRKLKVTGGTELCVQRLLSEEDLGVKEVLLRVRMGVPGEGRYHPAEEMVWNAAQDSSPGSLRSALAARYGLCPDALLLAKHQPDKHAWEAISSWSQQVSKRKKKKKAESLLGAPFHLKDGDTVGVKVPLGTTTIAGRAY
ncbi:hypothetical protein CRUP_019278 [Coryphaenoides rupestris]|nr:hypothetical protein CRUP_019278 [Coryphaenoides rupestris]